MKWDEKKPKPGDPVRVKAEFYYHYGIWGDEKHVYAFGLPNNEGTPAEEIAVVCTPVEDFTSGGMLERGRLGFKELMNRKSARNTVAYAEDHVGETGYDLGKNNCRHFMCRCLYGEKLAERFGYGVEE